MLLTLFVWFNPLTLDILVRAALFILGFDMMTMSAKVAVFVLNFIFPAFGDVFGTFSWTLLLLVMAELIIKTIKADRPYRLLVKPAAVFTTTFLSLGLQPALVVAGTDLLINITHKIKRRKRRRKKKMK